MNETTSENAMTLDQAFQHGVSLYQQKQPRQAREVFEQILHHAPDSVAVLQILCVLDMEDGKFDAAMSRLDAALEIEPENLSVWFDKANLLHQLGHNKDALLIVEVLQEQAPDNQDILALRQKLADATGNLADSRKTKRQMSDSTMIKRQVMSDEIEQTFAVALEMEQGGNFQQAADLYSAILAIDDRHVPAYQALSQLQIELEKPETARQTALRGLDLAESDLRLTVLLAKAEIMMGHYTAGREYCRKVLKTSPTELTAQRLIINSYEHEQNWIEVNRVATDMHREHPNDRQFLSQLAFSGFRLLRDKHNFVPESIIRCQKLMEKAISKSETEQQKDKFLPCLAETFWYAGEPKKSLEILDDYLNRYPQDIEAQFNACFIHRTLYNWDAFYDAFEKGIESGARLSYRGDIARWDLSRPKSDIVLVVPEQGVGDEIEFFHNLAIVVENAAKVYVACEPRLVPVLTISHPEVIAVPVKRVDHESMAIPEEVKRDITSWIAGGSLAAIAYQSSGKHHYQASYFSPPNDQVEKWSSHFDELKKAHNKKHVIGLSWRSGLAGASRNIHFLSVDDVARLVEAFPEALFVNLQYDDCSKEIRKIKKLSGVDIIQLEDIDLRDDFVGTGALIEACDLVITAATAIFRLTNAIGKECHLFYGWDKDSDHNVPVKLEWETGFGYYYPPLIENKYPVVDSIVKHVTGRLSSQ